MRAVCCVFPMLAALAWAGGTTDDEAIRKAIATFNAPHKRASVLARGADIAPLDRVGGQGVSQVYYEVTAIKFVSPDVAFVDATASQYGDRKTSCRGRGE